MIKKRRILAVVGMMLASVWSYGQSVSQVVKDLDAERYTAAQEAIGKLVSSAANAENYFYKGYAILNGPDYASEESLKAAKEAFEAGNALGKKGDALNQVGLGMVKLASGDLAGGKAIFEEVKKATKSKDPEVLYRIAEAYTMFSEANDPAEAVLLIDQALEKQKVNNNPEYYFVKADAYLMKGDGGAAMNALANAERIGTKQGKTYEKMAKVWLQSRNYKDALEVIQKGIEADPSHAPLYKYESSYYQTFGDFAKSAASASKYLQNSDGDDKAKIRASKLYFVAEDFASLKKILNEVKSTSSDPYVNRMEGIVNFKEANYTSAIDNFTKFIAAKPKDETFALDYGYIAKSYIKLDGDEATKASNLDKAIQFADKAAATGDSTVNIYAEVASLLMEGGNYSKGAELFEKGLASKKDANGSDFANAGLNYYRGGNYAKADEFFGKAIEEYKGAWPAAYALSAQVRTRMYSGDPEKNAQFLAASRYEEYLNAIGEEGISNPANKTYAVEALRYLAGRDYLLNKDVASAKAKLEKLLTIAPEDATAKEQLETFTKMLEK